jgi:hypothetical protein
MTAPIGSASRDVLRVLASRAALALPTRTEAAAG